MVDCSPEEYEPPCERMDQLDLEPTTMRQAQASPEWPMKDVYSRFPTKDPGEVSYYLGCNITWDHDVEIRPTPVRASCDGTLQRHVDQCHPSRM